MSVFEAAMLMCFGASWPLSLLRTWKVKSAKGKSLGFIALIFLGYLSGITHKLVYSRDPVIFLYLFNAIVVGADLMLSFYYRKCNRGLE